MCDENVHTTYFRQHRHGALERPEGDDKVEMDEIIIND